VKTCSNILKVSAKIYGILTVLAEGCPSFGRSCPALCVAHLSEKLGDVKLKKPAGDTLLAFAEKTSLQFVLCQGLFIPSFHGVLTPTRQHSIRATHEAKSTESSSRCIDMDQFCSTRIRHRWSVLACSHRISQNGTSEFQRCCANQCNKDFSHFEAFCRFQYVTDLFDLVVQN
jgi:hypothetical protein